MYLKEFTNVSPNAVAAANPDDFKIGKYMKLLEEGFEKDTDNLVAKFSGIYAFKVKNGPNDEEGYWVVNTKEGKGKVTYNGLEKPDVTFTINDNDVTDLVLGKLNPQKAFLQGKIKIQGNVSLAMKLVDLQKQAAGKIETIHSKL
ncbi:unnamed protein product [Arctia plantaginis]|uniref:SCP2 domain-containing protein n=1 Tax=Arctia plantaginis TaxID=874455 RepID=A0A8S0ZMX5_ARCPL|nr:unnamed protein product [Arctia plantaginis]